MSTIDTVQLRYSPTRLLLDVVRTLRGHGLMVPATFGNAREIHAAAALLTVLGVEPDVTAGPVGPTREMKIKTGVDGTGCPSSSIAFRLHWWLPRRRCPS